VSTKKEKRFCLKPKVNKHKGVQQGTFLLFPRKYVTSLERAMNEEGFILFMIGFFYFFWSIFFFEQSQPKASTCAPATKFHGPGTPTPQKQKGKAACGLSLAYEHFCFYRIFSFYS
jgi:hypothetical protein